MAGGPTVHLCHPFTARAIGWNDEDALPEFHSGPHTRALRHLGHAIGARSSVSYFTDAAKSKRVLVDGLSYRYWPRSLRVSGRHDGYRREWSFSELAREVRHPSDVTIINSSGHGGRFSQTHAQILRSHRRPYVAMIGGLHATTSGAQRRFLDEAALIAIHSKALRDKLVEEGLSADRLMLVPLGVDTDQFTPRPGGDTESPPTVLFVGRVVKLKGVDRLIEALAEITTVIPDAVVRIVGPEPDVHFSESMRDLADRVRVGEHVQFVGPLPRRDLAEEFRRASLTVLPSEAEGYGMVVAESMACGTPVVALEGSGGPEDMITCGEDGVLVAKGRLANAIIDLLRDPARLGALGDAARATAVARLSSSVTDTCFERLVHQALRNPRP